MGVVPSIWKILPIGALPEKGISVFGYKQRIINAHPVI